MSLQVPAVLVWYLRWIETPPHPHSSESRICILGLFSFLLFFFRRPLYCWTTSFRLGRSRYSQVPNVLLPSPWTAAFRPGRRSFSQLCFSPLSPSASGVVASGKPLIHRAVLFSNIQFIQILVDNLFVHDETAL